MLKEQPATGFEIVWSMSRNMTDIVQAIAAGYKRGYWLKAHIAPRQMGVVSRNVGWIGHNDVEFLCRERLEPIAVYESCIGDGQLLCVCMRNRQCRGGSIAAKHFNIRTRMGERQSDCATARAQVEHTA